MELNLVNLVKSLVLFSHNTLCFKELLRDFLSSVMIELNCDSLKHLQSEINNWGPKRSRGQDVVPGLHYGFDLLKKTG